MRGDAAHEFDDEDEKRQDKGGTQLALCHAVRVCMGMGRDIGAMRGIQGMVGVRVRHCLYSLPPSRCVSRRVMAGCVASPSRTWLSPTWSRMAMWASSNEW